MRVKESEVFLCISILVIVLSTWTARSFSKHPSLLYDEANYITSAAHMRFQGMRDIDLWTPPLGKLYMSAYILDSTEKFLLAPTDPIRVDINDAAIKFLNRIPLPILHSNLHAIRHGQLVLWVISLLTLAALSLPFTVGKVSILIWFSFSPLLISLLNIGYLEGFLSSALLLHLFAARQHLRIPSMLTTFLLSITSTSLALCKGSIIPLAVFSLIATCSLQSGNLRSRLKSLSVALAFFGILIHLFALTDLYVWLAESLHRPSYLNLVENWDITKHGFGKLVLALAKFKILPEFLVPQVFIARNATSGVFPLFLLGKVVPSQDFLNTLTFLVLKISPVEFGFLIAPIVLAYANFGRRFRNAFEVLLISDFSLYFAMLQSSPIKAVSRYWVPLFVIGAVCLLSVIAKAQKLSPRITISVVAALTVLTALRSIVEFPNYLSIGSPIMYFWGGSAANLSVVEDSGQDIERVTAEIAKSPNHFLVSRSLSARSRDLTIPRKCEKGSEITIGTTIAAFLSDNRFVSRPFFNEYPTNENLISSTGVAKTFSCESLKPFYDLINKPDSGESEGEINGATTIVVVCTGTERPKIEFGSAASGFAQASMMQSYLLTGHNDDTLENVWLVDALRDTSAWHLLKSAGKCRSRAFKGQF